MKNKDYIIRESVNARILKTTFKISRNMIAVKESLIMEALGTAMSSIFIFNQKRNFTISPQYYRRKYIKILFRLYLTSSLALANEERWLANNFSNYFEVKIECSTIVSLYKTRLSLKKINFLALIWDQRLITIVIMSTITMVRIIF